MPDADIGSILRQLYGLPTRPESENLPRRQPTYQTRRSSAVPQDRSGHPLNDPDLSSSSAASYYPSPQPSSVVSSDLGHKDIPSSGQAAKEISSRNLALQSKRTGMGLTGSCYGCRKSKKRCDRKLPCGRCKKEGKSADDCAYTDGWEPEESEEVVQVTKKARVGDAVEEMLPFGDAVGDAMGDAVFGRTPGGSSNTAPAPAPLAGPTPVDGSSYLASATLGRLDIKGQRSRYVPPGDKMSIMDHFEDSKSFITNDLNDPAMADIMRELSGFHETMLPNPTKTVPRLAIPPACEALKIRMFRALPDGFLYGALQTRLFLNWETIQRVLHIPIFSKECEVVAAAQTLSASIVPLHLGDWVLPQILAATAIVSRLEDPAFKHLTTGRISEEQIAQSIHLTRTWLERDSLHGNASICIHALQTRILLLLAQQVNLSSTQDLCMDSAALVRRAMSMGLHQDPEAYSDMSKLDKEMRRKLWTTIVELDLQISLAAGIPSAVTSSNFNLKSLVNVDDSELTAGMLDYPAGKPEYVWTNAMPQIALSASLKDRLDITNWLGGNLNLEHDAPALLAHASILERALWSLPQPYRGTFSEANVNNKRIDRLFVSIMLDMSIRQSLLAVYRTVTFSQQSDRFLEARRGALRCSLAMLSHLDELDPAVADLSIVKSRDYLNLFHIMYKDSIIQAALLICHEIRSFNTASLPSASANNTGQPEESIPQTKHSLTRVVENTLNSLISRLGDFGSDPKDILRVSVVLQSVRAEGTAEEMREVMLRGAERVVMACRRAFS